MKSQVLRLLILVTLLSGAHNAFAEVSIENALEDQKRICTYKDGIYEVNTIESNESFLLSAGERNEIIQQVVKKSGSLYFAVLFFPYIGNTQEGIRYSYQPNISVYKVTCRNQQSKILMSAGYGWSDTILNGAILNAEIDMIDDKYLVVKAYNATSKTNIHLFYDLVGDKQFFMDYTTNLLYQFNTILDFKPGKNGVGKVLIRLANMKTKWMSYDFGKKTIY